MDKLTPHSTTDNRSTSLSRGTDVAQRRGLELHEAWSELLVARLPNAAFFTGTFSDDYAERHCIYSHESALNNAERWISKAVPTARYFLAAEDHWERDTPHLHGLVVAPNLPLRVLWESWFQSRGRCRFEVPRSEAAAAYCAKYALTDSSDSYRFRLRHAHPERRPRALRGSPLQPGAG